MTVKQAYKILIEDYYYATDESKEALEVLVCAYDYLYRVDYYNFLENRKRMYKNSKKEDFIISRDEFERKFKVDLTKLEGMKEEG